MNFVSKQVRCECMIVASPNNLVLMSCTDAIMLSNFSSQGCELELEVP